MSGRPRAAKPAARSKSASAQKPKPAPARPKPAKKPAARAAPAPAAAAPPPAPEPTVVFHPVTTAVRKARTLATWREQKNNAAFFTNYCYTIKNEETGEEVHVFRSAFTVKGSGSKGGFCELQDALAFAREAYLSRIPDESELWGDPDAAALKERSREIINRPPERQDNGFTRNFRPGAKVEVTRSGDFKVASYQQVDGETIWKRRVIDEAKLDALRSKRGADDELYRTVLDFAEQFAAASDDDQRAVLLDRALNIDRSLEVAALRRFDKIERRVAEKQSLAWAEFEEDVDFDEDVKADLSRECGRPVTSLMDVDDFPRACLLGDADHCPIHGKIMEWFYLSERRNATRGVQGRVPLLYSRHHLLLTIGGRPRQGPLPEVY